MASSAGVKTLRAAALILTWLPTAIDCSPLLSRSTASAEITVGDATVLPRHRGLHNSLTAKFLRSRRGCPVLAAAPIEANFFAEFRVKAPLQVPGRTRICRRARMAGAWGPARRRLCLPWLLRVGRSERASRGSRHTAPCSKPLPAQTCAPLPGRLMAGGCS